MTDTSTSTHLRQHVGDRNEIWDLCSTAGLLSELFDVAFDVFDEQVLQSRMVVPRYPSADAHSSVCWSCSGC